MESELTERANWNDDRVWNMMERDGKLMRWMKNWATKQNQWWREKSQKGKKKEKKKRRTENGTLLGLDFIYTDKSISGWSRLRLFKPRHTERKKMGDKERGGERREIKRQEKRGRDSCLINTGTAIWHWITAHIY